MIGLGDLPGSEFWSQASAVTPGGGIVVGRSKSTASASSYYREAFRWSQQTGMVGLGDLPGGWFNSYASSVSDDGTVIAGSGVSDQSTGQYAKEAFRWTEQEGMLGLGDLPGGEFHSEARDMSGNGRVLVGNSKSAMGREASMWTEDTGMMGLGDLPGGEFLSTAYGVSDDGRVVIGCSKSANSVETGAYEGFRWTEDEGMVGLGSPHLHYFDSHPQAIAGNGSLIVGYSKTSHIDDIAVIWDASHGIRYFKDVLVGEYGLELNGWELSCATDVSRDGTMIAGYGFNPDGIKEAWIAVIPEPATLVLLGLGGVALAGRIGRRAGRARTR